ncbi:hypothetical protein ACFX5D_05775 [Flavobacterium sp. LB3P45]|uniref:Uncharacterized protein n=1 Tax=Flavobacterium fructosi TaxID=3230416 RepID=A0ABW6HKB9_9FLAO
MSYENRNLKNQHHARILNSNDNKILSKIAKLLDVVNSVGYDANGNLITEKEYVSANHNVLNLLADGKLETYSSEEVKRKIVSGISHSLDYFC